MDQKTNKNPVGVQQNNKMARDGKIGDRIVRMGTLDLVIHQMDSRQPRRG